MADDGCRLQTVQECSAGQYCAILCMSSRYQMVESWQAGVGHGTRTELLESLAWTCIWFLFMKAFTVVAAAVVSHLLFFRR